ncbi:MAG: hypothetical protein CSB46_03370, partial [Micrococcales bacterium]
MRKLRLGLERLERTGQAVAGRFLGVGTGQVRVFGPFQFIVIAARPVQGVVAFGLQLPGQLQQRRNAGQEHRGRLAPAPRPHEPAD